MSLQNAYGPVNAEVVADPSTELRTTDCSNCGGKETITEKAVGRDLKTVVKCDNCGFEYFERE